MPRPIHAPRGPSVAAPSLGWFGSKSGHPGAVPSDLGAASLLGVLGH